MLWKPFDRRTRTAIAVALFAMTEPFVSFPAIGAPPSPPAAPAAPPPTALQRLDGSANAIPTRPEIIDGLDRPLHLPDWDRITFATLSGALEDGSFSAPTAAVRALGYNPSRSWQRGETPDRYLMLGDFEDSLRLQDFSLGDLGQVTGTDLGPVALSQFGPARYQTASYGRELAGEYFRQLKLNGESDCGVATGQFVNPAPGFPITSGFGYRRPPCAGCSSFHAALDFGTPMGTPIAAADGGRVIHAGWVSGWGKTVVIDHGNGYQTRYSHLNSLDVSVGDAVAQGDAIARSGMTGLGTGPHLDFAVYRGHWNGGSGKAINPRSLLKL